MSKKMQRRVSWGAVPVCVGVMVLTGLFLWHPDAVFHEMEPVHAESAWDDQDLPELCTVVGDSPEVLIERYLGVASALELPEDLAGKRSAYGYHDIEFFKLKIKALHETTYALLG